MKKLMYLFVAGTMFAFTACNCGTGDAAATDAVEEVLACADDCKKGCCLGCKATEGEASCALLKAGDHSCCAAPKGEHDHKGNDDNHPHPHK